MADINGKFLCAICMDNVLNCDKYITRCNHEFCIPCLFKYLDMDHHKQKDKIPCPICRDDISNIIRDEPLNDADNISDLFDIISIQNNLREEIGAPSIRVSPSNFGIPRLNVPRLNINDAYTSTTSINGNMLFNETSIFPDRSSSRIIRSPMMQFHNNLELSIPSIPSIPPNPSIPPIPPIPPNPPLPSSRQRLFTTMRTPPQPAPYSNSRTTNSIFISRIWQMTGRYPSNKQNQ